MQTDKQRDIQTIPETIIEETDIQHSFHLQSFTNHIAQIALNIYIYIYVCMYVYKLLSRSYLRKPTMNRHCHSVQISL